MSRPRIAPLYIQLAPTVSSHPDMLAFLPALPQGKWQPQLLFSAVQLLQGPPATGNQFVDAFHTRADDIAAAMLSHTTQTSIPARCATLLPALAALPQPPALVEVGGSAGLCLHPDRYSYDYDGHRVAPLRDGGVPPFRCTASPGNRAPTPRLRSSGGPGSTCTPLTPPS